MFPSNNYNGTEFGSTTQLGEDEQILLNSFTNEDLQMILLQIGQTLDQPIQTLDNVEVNNNLIPQFPQTSMPSIPLHVQRFQVDGTETEFSEVDMKPNPDQLVPPLQLSPLPVSPRSDLSGSSPHTFGFGGLPVQISSYVAPRTVALRCSTEGQLVPSVTQRDVRRSLQRKVVRNKSDEQTVVSSPAEVSSVEMYFDEDSNLDHEDEEGVIPGNRSRSFQSTEQFSEQSPDSCPDRRERRREQNRRAARKCRDRRKEQMDKLRRDYDRVMAENIRQKEQIAKLNAEREQLAIILRSHQMSCAFKLT